MLPEHEFHANILGENGAEEQLRSFLACWERGTTYINAVQQAALGCAMKCADTTARPELEALCLVLSDITTWFERCREEYRSMDKKASAEEKHLH